MQDCTIDIPSLEDNIWSDIVRGAHHFEFESLAIRILQGTLARSIAKDSSPENIRRCARALREVFAENASLPSIQNDLKKLCKS